MQATDKSSGKEPRLSGYISLQPYSNQDLLFFQRLLSFPTKLTNTPTSVYIYLIQWSSVTSKEKASPSEGVTRYSCNNFLPCVYTENHC